MIVALQTAFPPVARLSLSVTFAIQTEMVVY
jgi:hypothetical protein